ncbi:MAG: DUF1828 domain-containing protein [Bryobacteraceae bacterium]
MNGLDELKSRFNGHVAFRERRPGVMQVLVPLFHEDGDMVDLFVDEKGAAAGQMRVSDHGMTLMRLSYNLDIETESRQKVLHRILAENGVGEEEGRLYVDAEPERLYPAILHFAQTVAKVSSMQFYKREVIQSLFYELLDEFVEERLGQYQPRLHVAPVEGHDEYEVDVAFAAGARPIYLFGVKDNAKARLATICCQAFQGRQLPFKSIAVYEDFENIGRKDRLRLTNACDKQFTSLDEFRENGAAFLARETA